MPHEFTEWEYEPETQAASARGGGPPGILVGAGVLDPPEPPAKPSGASATLARILVSAVLIAIGAGLVMLLWHP